MLVLLQCLLFCAVSAQAFGWLAMRNQGLHLDVLASAQDQDIQELYATLQSLPSVQYVDFIPKEKAYEQQKISNPDIAAFFDEYKLGNPLPDSFVVALRNADDYPGFIAQMQGEEYRKVLEPSSLAMVSGQEGDLRDVLGMVSNFQMITFGLAALAVLVLCAMMAEYVARSLRLRHDEFILQNALGASRVSLTSLLASEMTIIFLWGFVLSIAFAAGIVAAFVFAVFHPSQVGSLFAANDSVWPYLFGTLSLAFLAELVLMPAFAWHIASRGIRKELARPQ